MGKYIDLLKAKDAFDNYVKDFDENDRLIARKIYHTYNVVEFSKIVSKNIGFDEENIELASLIALLHDIGRFKQAKKYHTFNDCVSIDHADLGVEILFSGKKQKIREFIETNKYDTIIYLAIKNHNKFEIQKGLNEIELKQTKCIRDSDKLDIFPGFYEREHPFFDEETLKKSFITDEVMQSIYNHKTVLKSDMKNQNVDTIILTLALIFDLNYDISLKIVKDKEFVSKVINKYYEFLNDETKKKLKEAEKVIVNYIENKIK